MPVAPLVTDAVRVTVEPYCREPVLAESAVVEFAFPTVRVAVAVPPAYPPFAACVAVIVAVPAPVIVTVFPAIVATPASLDAYVNAPALSEVGESANAPSPKVFTMSLKSIDGLRGAAALESADPLSVATGFPPPPPPRRMAARKASQPMEEDAERRSVAPRDRVRTDAASADAPARPFPADRLDVNARDAAAGTRANVEREDESGKGASNGVGPDNDAETTVIPGAIDSFPLGIARDDVSANDVATDAAKIPTMAMPRCIPWIVSFGAVECA